MKNKIDLVVGWIKKGERDLKVAMRELAQQEIFTDVVCFHAQQAGVDELVLVFIFYFQILKNIH